MTCATERMRAEEIGNLYRVVVVLPQPERQSLEPLNELKGIEGRDRRTDVAQEFYAGAQDIRDRPERLRGFGPDGTVIGAVRLGQQRKARGMLFPREVAAIDDKPADRGAVSADIFGRRINDHRCAMLERPGNQRRRRIVGNQRHSERSGRCQPLP